MKKKAKKLVLAKETVRSMDMGDLRQVAGGTMQNTYCYGCYSGDVRTCASCVQTCASRLC